MDDTAVGIVVDETPVIDFQKRVHGRFRTRLAILAQEKSLEVRCFVILLNSFGLVLTDFSNFLLRSSTLLYLMKREPPLSIFSFHS